jgi:hypothetical protein
LFKNPCGVIKYVPGKLLTLDVQLKLIEIDPKIFEKFDLETKNIILKEYLKNHQEVLFNILQNIELIKELINMRSDLEKLVDLKSEIDELLEMKPKLESTIKKYSSRI